jgi:hypothetical protein
MKVNFKEIKHRQDYLSVDKLTAISSNGEILGVGDLVEHDDKEAGTATIQSFAFDYELNEVIANTEKGSAHISFIFKVKENGN